ncbi:TPA: hypothetical protein EYP26_00030 [Candidatus Bathyarchaeota archaeon]|nr:hypothetical protein [Candidatus Bathyarchaeota archaeon]
MGLTEYESLAYGALAAKPSSTAEGVSKESGIPLPKVYAVLSSLEEKGFVRARLGRPRLFEALPPSEALENYVKFKRKEMEETISKIKEVGSELRRELEPLYWERALNVKPEELLKPLPDLAAAEAETLNLIRTAEIEVSILTSTFGWFRKVEKELKKALKRKVKVRVLILTKEGETKVRSLVEAGGLARISSSPYYPIRGTVADWRKLVFVIWASREKETYWHPIAFRPHVSTHPGLAKIFSEAFEKLWGEARSL